MVVGAPLIRAAEASRRNTVPVMRVDGRDITVSGSLLPPVARRTNDILRVVLAAVFFIIVIAGSLITRAQWVALEQAISRIVGVLPPAQSNLIYLVYGAAIVALPFLILIGLIARHRWKLLGAYAAAGLIALLSLSISGDGFSAPRWHFALSAAPRHHVVAVPR